MNLKTAKRPTIWNVGGTYYYFILSQFVLCFVLAQSGLRRLVSQWQLCGPSLRFEHPDYKKQVFAVNNGAQSTRKS